MSTPEQERIDSLYQEAEKNLVNYRYMLLESDPTHEVQAADYHYKWSDDLLHGEENEAKEGFRESGKSQYVLRAFPLYSLTYPSKKRDYIVIIKNNSRLAESKLKEIETEYITNGLISANMVRIREQSGKVFSVDVKDKNGEIINVRIEAYGKGSSVRGLSNKERRPKIVICDDLQDRDEMKGEAVPESDWKWFMSDIYFLGKTSRIFLISNNLGEKCIIERIFASKGDLGFKCERTSAIKVVGSKEVSAWPTKYTVAEIYEQRDQFQRQGLLGIWLEEKMCQSVAAENRIFNPDDYRYFPHTTTDKILAECNRYGVLDPASSPEISSCYRAIVVAGVDCDNTWFVSDIPYGRWNPTQLIDQIFGAVQKYELKDFGIEKGVLKQVLEHFIYKEMAHRNIFFNIIPIEHAKKGSKLERIKMLQPRFIAHRIWFPESAPWLAELFAELAGVTKDGIKSLYIDLVDALAMISQMAKAPGKRKNPHSAVANRRTPEPVAEARLI